MGLTRILDYEEGAVKPNENCLLIPELRAVMEKYDDPIPALAYIYYMVAPDSAYANLEKEERAEMVNQDVGGDFSLEDEEIDAAMEKCEKLMYTKVQRAHRASGMSLDKISKYLETAEVEAGRDGSGDLLYKYNMNLPKLMEAHRKLEKMAIEDQQTKLRGSAQAGLY